MPRNRGAELATGDVLLFLDADVCVHSDTLQRMADRLDANPQLDALIGSYDDSPSSPDFLSQYRNLLHCFVHQTGNPRASTFWSGCGAIRRTVFLAEGGFDTRYEHADIEDVELGYRLRASGRRVALDRSALVCHLKQWNFVKMVETDVWHRGVPWTRLILESRSMPNDLNLGWSQRVSVAACCLSGAIAGLCIADPGIALLGFLICTLLTAITGILNLGFFRFLLARRGPVFAFGAFPLQLFFFLYSGCSFALGAALHTLDSSSHKSLSDSVDRQIASARTAGLRQPVVSPIAIQRLHQQ